MENGKPLALPGGNSIVTTIALFYLFDRRSVMTNDFPVEGKTANEFNKLYPVSRTWIHGSTLRAVE